MLASRNAKPGNFSRIEISGRFAIDIKPNFATRTDKTRVAGYYNLGFRFCPKRVQPRDWYRISLIG